MRSAALPRRLNAVVGLTCLLALAAACGMNPEKNYRKLRPKLVDRDFDGANAYIDGIKEDFYSKDNRLLFYMDKGMVLHLGKRYKESNDFLEKAKTAAEELWTESISKNAAAFLTTDNTIPYQGEDFEKVLIHFVAALNYVGLGEYDAARVEARQITNKLVLYNQKYTELEEGGDTQAAVANHYRDDAFARWLSGKLAETQGDFEGMNDAKIDYMKALELYENDYVQRYGTQVPRFIVEDTLRVLKALGADFKDEFEQVKAKYPSVAFNDHDKKKGELVFIHLNGEAPFKKDEFWDAQAGNDTIRIAFPKFIAKPTAVRTARMSVNGVSVDTEVAEDLTAIAIENLNDRMGRIQAKAIARAVAKYLVAKGTQAAGNQVGGGAGTALQLGGALFQAGSNIAEEADKRSWITLPASVGVSRVFVDPGDYSVDVEFYNATGQLLETTQLTTKVEAGKPAFVYYRTFD